MMFANRLAYSCKILLNVPAVKHFKDFFPSRDANTWSREAMSVVKKLRRSYWITQRGRGENRSTTCRLVESSVKRPPGEQHLSVRCLSDIELIKFVRRKRAPQGEVSKGTETFSKTLIRQGCWSLGIRDRILSKYLIDWRVQGNITVYPVLTCTVIIKFLLTL